GRKQPQRKDLIRGPHGFIQRAAGVGGRESESRGHPPAARSGDWAILIKVRDSANKLWARKGRTLLLDFLPFCFVHRAGALLNSTPQLLAGDRRAVVPRARSLAQAICGWTPL